MMLAPVAAAAQSRASSLTEMQWFQPATVQSDNARTDRGSGTDGSGDGALKGALIGAGVGVGLVAVGYATCGSCDAPERKKLYPVGAAYGAGIGALVGWAVDKLLKRPETALPLVAPVLSDREQALVVSVRF
jgi:hypothetical protein